MSNVSAMESVNLSQEFYSDPGSYSRFSLTKDYRRIIGCIDPRDPTDETPGNYKVMVQTAGAGVGEGLDLALAATAFSADYLMTIDDAVKTDKASRVATVFGGHYACRFVGGLRSVVEEMVEPSDFTRDSIRNFAGELGVRDLVKSNLGRIQSAGARHLEEGSGSEVASKSANLDSLVDHLDVLNPDHRNVKKMRGDNTSRVYVMNFHPHISIDRNKKPVDIEDPALIQGYHDGLKASSADVGNDRLEDTVRQLRLTSMIARSAAVRTVLTAAHMDEMTFLEVRATHDGVNITERKY